MTEVSEEAKEDTSTDAPNPLKGAKVYRWNGVGNIQLPNGNAFIWANRVNTLVTTDEKDHKILDPIVDGRFLEELASDSKDAADAIEMYLKGATPLNGHTGGSFGATSAVTGMINAGNVRGATVNSNSAEDAGAQTASVAAQATLTLQQLAAAKAASSPSNA